MKDFEEMRKVIEEHCIGYISDDPWEYDACMGCPLEGRGTCYSTEDKKLVEENYNILVESTAKVDVKAIMEEKETVNHPEHYNNGMECIDEMILVFGKRVVADFCLCNVWKYRYRAFDKNGKEDIDKAHWYMNKYRELVGDLDE